MNTTKRLACAITFLGLLVCVLCFSVSAEEFKEGNYTYTVADGCATITLVDQSISGDIVIPDTLGGYPVAVIGDYAFNSCANLESITIPDGITIIGDYAFVNCSNLKSITIPDSITWIGEGAFYGYGPDSVYITDIVSWCSISRSDFHSSPLYFGADLYLNGEKVTELTIPDSVTSIEGCAFSGCASLESVTIPDSVTVIGEDAFMDCSNLKNIMLPDSVIGIGDFAFDGCTSLETITIPDSVEIIGSSVFRGCTSLTTVELPDNITSISEYAFSGCTSLNSVKIPNSVTTIVCGAFSGCESLENITIPDSVTTIDMYAFDNCSSLNSVKIPDSVTTIGAGAFSNCDSLESIKIPDSVTDIGNYAFYCCYNLGNIIIGDGVTSIGYYAFYNPMGLTNVHYCGTEERWNKITIDMNGHEEFMEIIHFATDGNNDGICDLCSYVMNEVEHTHSYTSSVTKAATCTTGGMKTYTCSCEDSYTEEISAKGHDIVFDKAVASTCTATGLTEGSHCSGCDDMTVAQQTVATVDHIDNNSDYKCDYGCGYEFEKPADPTPDEPTDDTCDHICHKSGFMGFIYNIVKFFWKLFKTNQYCECGAAHY